MTSRLLHAWSPTCCSRVTESLSSSPSCGFMFLPHTLHPSHTPPLHPSTSMIPPPGSLSGFRALCHHPTQQKSCCCIEYLPPLKMFFLINSNFYNSFSFIKKTEQKVQIVPMDSLPHLNFLILFPFFISVVCWLCGEGNGNHYCYLENPMDRGAWQATVHGVTSSGHDLVTKLPPPHVGCN